MSMPSRPRTGSGLLVAVVISIAVTAVTIGILAAAGVTPQAVWDGFFPVDNVTPVTDRGIATKALYDIVFYIAAAIFIVVEILIVYTVIRYRRRPGDDELPAQTHGNNLVEVIWTAIPTLIVLFLFVASWQTLNTVEAKTPGDVHVSAVAARYQWRFDYLSGPDTDDPNTKPTVLYSQLLPVGEDGGLVVPVGEPIHISLTSPDVIHAFYVPKFLFKRDVVPGRLNTFDFTVEEPGTYRGQCAELCGAFHGSMVFEVRAVSRAEYDAWLKAAIEKASATPSPAPSAEAGGAVVELEAKGTAFTQRDLRVPAGAPFTIKYRNQDAGIPHDILVKDAAGSQVFKSDLITGVAEVDVAVPALVAGTYPFVCSVHPNMTGTLTAE